MKARIILSIVLASTFFLSCKNDKSTDSLDAVKPEEVTVDNVFRVSLNVIVKKDDDFALFYTEDGSINFQDKPIWQGVKGSENSQEVKFALADGVYPTQLRLDFGLKKDQEDIILKSVTFEYRGNKRVIAGSEIINFFRADGNKCTFDPATGLIKGIVKNGEKQCASMYPQEANLGPELKKFGAAVQ